MVHLSFADWKDAPNARLFYMDTVPGFGGYKCAPEVFYFAPQKKWYFIFQTQPPAYCTSETPNDPKSWSAPQPFFAQGTPLPRLPIDYHCIGDGEHMYLFFTGDDGNFYRSRTTYAEFPKGFSNPVIAMRGTRATVFEGSLTYKIKGTDKYLTCVEALSPTRFYRAYIADKLDGEWYPVAGLDTFEQPFAGSKNMTFDEGVAPWTGQVSHGEMVRDGNDERMILDPNNLMFLFQGISDADNRGDYGRLPYRLGLLRASRIDELNPSPCSIAACSCCQAPASTTTRRSSNLPLFIRIGRSPLIPPPNAKKVEVVTQFTRGNQELKLGSNGVWSVTLGPADPNLYPYNFIVDGLSVADPSNVHLFPNERFKSSLVDIPGEQPAIYSAQDVPHGEVRYCYYQSQKFGIRPLLVYTPPCYQDGAEKYPVFYLVSGTTDTEETWFKVGRVNFILDNLIAQKKAVPMVVVMPYGNMLSGTPDPTTLQAAEMYKAFTDELIGAIMPCVERHYRVSHRQARRRGFSRGGGQSLFAGFSNLDNLHGSDLQCVSDAEVFNKYSASSPKRRKDQSQLNCCGWWVAKTSCIGRR